MSEPPEPRRPHLIRPDEVNAWLADSAVKTVTYHRTTAAAARSILEHGISIERSVIGAYGQGFYTATETDPFYGDVEVAFAIKLRTPLVGSADEVVTIASSLTRRFDPLGGRITPAVASAIRRELLRSGYDGIIAYDAGGDGIDYVVALRADSVRVVQGIGR